MLGRAQGLLKLLSISSSSFLPLLVAGVIACSSRGSREGKRVSPRTAGKPVGEESQASSVFFTGMDLVTEFLKC